MIKNNISKLILLLVTAGAFLTACKDDDNPQADRERKIMHNWRMTAITTPKVGQPTVDSSISKPCMTDDLMKFSSAGFDFEDGATKCDTTIFPYSKGTWFYKLAGDSIQLLRSAPTPAKYTSWKVLLLNDSVMQVRYTDSTNPANKINKTISFKH